MATIHEVEIFLKDFKTKVSIFGIFFRDDRQKNTQARFDLELEDADRIEIIKSLIATDYSEGPVGDTLYGVASLWIFGKRYKNQEIYIKISLGFKDNPALCISFHKAERPMKYPLI